MGALVWEKVVHHHQGWRLVSSMWLHAGVLHLVANMLCLLFVGMRLEQQFGYGELLHYYSRAEQQLPYLPTPIIALQISAMSSPMECSS